MNILNISHNKIEIAFAVFVINKILITIYRVDNKYIVIYQNGEAAEVRT